MEYLIGIVPNSLLIPLFLAIAERKHGFSTASRHFRTKRLARRAVWRHFQNVKRSTPTYNQNPMTTLVNYVK